MTKKTSTNEILSATCEEEKPLVAAQIALGELYRRAGEEGFTDEIQRAINQQANLCFSSSTTSSKRKIS
jgi:lipopolysaccharide biosynthesis regulator YciM